jgi:pimeloyl-ACP methyl ester carboxylesterase
MFKNKQIIINNIAVSYLDEGSGSVLLFLHGWLDSKETFVDLVDQLKTQYRCIALDLPNFGSSQSSELVITLDSFANFLQLFISKMNINNYALVGHSMGGQIAIYATGHNIIEPRKLILIASAGVRNNKKLLKNSLKNASKLIRHFIPKNMKNKIYKSIGSDYNTNLKNEHKKIISNVLEQDIQGDAKKIKAPTLLIYGSTDTHTAVRIGRLLKSSINNSKLEILNGANHWLHKTDSKKVSELIRKFYA